MIEKQFTWRWLFVFAGAGILFGLVLGLVAGWAFPLSTSSAAPSALKPETQNDYIVLVANSFAYDSDISLARDRLALLKDSNIKIRVERLARSLSAKQDPAAANVADLAVGLGSTDSALRVLAASVTKTLAGGEPTKMAKLEVEPTQTLAPTALPTNTIAATATLQPTAAPTKAPTKAATKAPTVAQQAANTPVPTSPPAAAAPQPQIQPGLDMWWNVQYVPANVSAGQQYWRLVYARYCDWVPQESMNPCPNMPGGIMDHTIYVMALDENGGCGDSTIRFDINDGSKQDIELGKDIAYPWYSAQCRTQAEKAMYGEGNAVSVNGLPSDKITNLTLCAKNPPAGWAPPPCGHAHVHYFLVFQRATR